MYLHIQMYVCMFRVSEKRHLAVRNASTHLQRVPGVFPFIRLATHTANEFFNFVLFSILYFFQFRFLLLLLFFFLEFAHCRQLCTAVQLHLLYREFNSLQAICFLEFVCICANKKTSAKGIANNFLCEILIVAEVEICYSNKWLLKAFTLFCFHPLLQSREPARYVNSDQHTCVHTYVFMCMYMPYVV